MSNTTRVFSGKLQLHFLTERIMLTFEVGNVINSNTNRTRAVLGRNEGNIQCGRTEFYFET